MFDSIRTFVEFITAAHPYMQALAVLGAALVVALVVLPFVAGIVKYLTRKTETDVDDELIAALNTPVFYFVLLVGAQVALPLLVLTEGLRTTIDNALQTFIILVIAQAILSATKVLIQGAAKSNRLEAINDQTQPLFINLSLIIIIAGALYGVFLIWGIDVTAWLASAGIIGIAVGFAAKDTLSNIISGIFILADKPYSVGDFVELGSGTTGIVSNVGLRSTRIRTFNDEEVTIPNASIANAELTNKSTGPDTGRVKVDIGVAYGSDVKNVEKILLEAARAHELVVEEPEPTVHFVEFGDSSLNFMLSCRVEDPLTVFGTKSELRYAINERFAKENIEIPFPQRDVHLKK